MRWYEPCPLNVLPMGNAADDSRQVVLRQKGSLAFLATDFILESILCYSDERDLCRLSGVSVWWHAVAEQNELWRQLASTRQMASSKREKGARRLRVEFCDGWKRTAIAMRTRPQVDVDDTSAPSATTCSTSCNTRTLLHQPTAERRLANHKCYDDVLFHNWLCATCPPYHPWKLPPGSAETCRRPAASGTASRKRPRHDATSRRTGPPAAGSPHRLDVQLHTVEPPCKGVSSDELIRQSPFRRVAVFEHKSEVPAAEAASGTTPSHWRRKQLDAFRDRFERPNLPAVIKGLATAWPLFRVLDGETANLSLKRSSIFVSGAQPDFQCESLIMSIDEYVSYARHQQDERPTYLFDPHFADTLQPGLWRCPEYFDRDDLFQYLSDPPSRTSVHPQHGGAASDEAQTNAARKRPHYRWLICGPARGGSSFHVDPNYTNAWNACLTGRKRWILFPPHLPPPGVIPSRDMLDVTTPTTLAEWLLTYYPSSAADPKFRREGFECICDAGDVMFVPCGWWHFVVNLESSVAITQNFVSEANLAKVVTFLRGMPDAISGVGEEDDDTDIGEEQKAAPLGSSRHPAAGDATKAIGADGDAGSNQTTAAASCRGDACTSLRIRMVKHSLADRFVDVVRHARPDLAPVLEGALSRFSHPAGVINDSVKAPPKRVASQLVMSDSDPCLTGRNKAVEAGGGAPGFCFTF